MSELSTEIRSYFDEHGPAIDIEEVRAHPLIEVGVPKARERPIRRDRLIPAALSVLIVLVGVWMFSALQKQTPSTRSFIRVDACQVLAESTGPAAMTRPHDQTAWGADVCLHDGWDSGWNFRHLLLKQTPTSRQEARELIGSGEDLLSNVRPLQWTSVGSGRWAAESTDGNEIGFSAVAVSVPPYFFIVTEEDSEEAARVADAVARGLADLSHRR